MTIEFVSKLIINVKSINLIHNQRIHQHLKSLTILILNIVKRGEINVSEYDAKQLGVIRTILSFLQLIISTSINYDKEITKFFIDEPIFIPFEILLEFVKHE